MATLLLSWSQFMSKYAQEHPHSTRQDISKAWATYKTTTNSNKKTHDKVHVISTTPMRDTELRLPTTSGENYVYDPNNGTIMLLYKLVEYTGNNITIPAEWKEDIKMFVRNKIAMVTSNRPQQHYTIDSVAIANGGTLAITLTIETNTATNFPSWLARTLRAALVIPIANTTLIVNGELFLYQPTTDRREDSCKV